MSKEAKVYDIEEYRRKRKARAVRNRIITAIVVLILAVITFLGVYFYQNYDIEDLIANAKDNTSQSGELGDSFPVSLSGITPLSITASGNSLVLLTGEEEMFYSGSNTGHHFNHRYTNPIIKEVKGRVLTYDRGGYSYRIDSSSGLHLSDRTEDVILTASISDSKDYAIVTKAERYAGCVTVFNRSNDEVLKWYSGTEQIVDVSISKNGRNLAVLCAGFDNGILSSKVYVIDLKRKSTEPRAVVSFDNSMPVALDYKKNGEIHIVTDNSICIISKDFNAKREVSFNNQLRKLLFNGNRTYVITSAVNSVSCTVLMTDGEVENSQTLKLDLLDVAHNGKKIFVLGKNQIKVLDRELFPIGTIKVKNDVYSIEAIGNHIYLLSGNALDVMSAEIPDTAE